MSKQTILIVLALATGVTIGIFLNRDHADAPEGVADLPASAGTPVARADGVDEENDIEALRVMLEDEIRARRALERKLTELGRQVEALESAGAGVSVTSDLDTPDDGAGDAQQDRRTAGWFDTQALVASGMDDSLASELQLFYEQVEMERLFLRDQSLREGWDRQQYRSALGEIEDREAALRQRLGEQGYDAYLYASGQPNRVAVTSVLASAPAGQAGIEAGDHILRYDNQRIYDWFELREATAGGEIGDTVSVEVDRDGQTLQFYLARGPLGIRMNSLSVAP